MYESRRLFPRGKPLERALLEALHHVRHLRERLYVLSTCSRDRGIDPLLDAVLGLSQHGGFLISLTVGATFL